MIHTFFVSLGYEAMFFLLLWEIAIVGAPTWQQDMRAYRVRHSMLAPSKYVASTEFGSYVRGNLRLLSDGIEEPSDTVTVAASSLDFRCHGNIAQVNREGYMIAKLVEQKK